MFPLLLVPGSQTCLMEVKSSPLFDVVSPVLSLACYCVLEDDFYQASGLRDMEMHHRI